jgi:hypothetical protein
MKRFVNGHIFTDPKTKTFIINGQGDDIRINKMCIHAGEWSLVKIGDRVTIQFTISHTNHGGGNHEEDREG